MPLFRDKTALVEGVNFAFVATSYHFSKTPLMQLLLVNVRLVNYYSSVLSELYLDIQAHVRSLSFEYELIAADRSNARFQT